MDTDKKTTLINLITADLAGLNEVALAELYSMELKLQNGTSLCDIQDMNPDIVIKKFMDEYQLNSAASTIYCYTKLIQDFLNHVNGVLTYVY
ncbi:MAG: hypothetical protein M1326_09100 [Cyanobacteria bacterium]|nr:hypothetical protein [Cyanobacteriota bacterium]